ncbi:hypothetical protein ACFE04_015372 [Oxalis oulophora]
MSVHEWKSQVSEKIRVFVNIDIVGKPVGVCGDYDNASFKLFDDFFLHRRDSILARRLRHHLLQSGWKRLTRSRIDRKSPFTNHFLFNQRVAIVYRELGCALKRARYCLTLSDAGMDVHLSMTSPSSCTTPKSARND